MKEVKVTKTDYARQRMKAYFDSLLNADDDWGYFIGLAITKRRDVRHTEYCSNNKRHVITPSDAAVILGELEALKCELLKIHMEGTYELDTCE